MTAEEYLNQLQGVYRRYNYLVEILWDRRDIMMGQELPDSDEVVLRIIRPPEKGQ